MKPFAKLNEAPFVFNVLRVAVLFVGALGTWFALILVYLALFGLSSAPFTQVNIAAGVGIATVVLVSVCCYVALGSFFRLCGRLRRGSAFTEENAAAMRRIAIALLAGGALASAGLTAVALLIGSTLGLAYLWLFAFAFFGAALLSHALAVLVRRAAALQRDSDLTI